MDPVWCPPPQKKEKYVSRVNSKAKPPKAKIALKWVTFLRVEFVVHLATMAHPIVVDVSR